VPGMQTTREKWTHRAHGRTMLVQPAITQQQHHHVHGANITEHGRPTRTTQSKTVGNEQIILPYVKDVPDSKDNYARNNCAKNKTPYR
jgi:hypothetical protein